MATCQSIEVAALAPFSTDLIHRVADWYASLSRGRCRLVFSLLPPVSLPRPLDSYSHRGGKGAWPGNSQALALQVAQSFEAKLAGRLLLIASTAFLPHAWHIRNTRYAIVPSNATLGTLAHELGHLVFDWPDLRWPPDMERECLMACGATGELGSDPAPPCAPLLLRERWREPLPLTRELLVRHLSPTDVASLDWNGRTILVERRPSRLLLYAAEDPPSVHARIALCAGDEDKAVLGLIARSLRGASAAVKS